VQQRDVDVIVGTQMIAKGHDWAGVTLVGIVLADIALAMPDFRADERGFQVLHQVAGRAGRRSDTAASSKVILQTYKPNDTVITHLVANDVAGFRRALAAQRQELSYPPFVRMAIVRVEGEDEAIVHHVASDVAKLLRKQPEIIVDGPALAPIERIADRHRTVLMVRSKKHTARHAALETVRSNEPLLQLCKKHQLRLIVDVDPVHML
jgi:primosomal protein N' (replication factor Y) (superfamily II helicase)